MIESFEEKFNRKLREDRKIDITNHVNYLTLLRKTGGNWLGRAREWIQRKAFNGEHVTWGSSDVLKLKHLTVQDIELFAAEIAADAINEHNKRLESCGIKGFEKEKHIETKKQSTTEKLFPIYAQAINELDDYFEYTNESKKDKAFVMGVIDRLTEQVKNMQENDSE